MPKKQQGQFKYGGNNSYVHPSLVATSRTAPRQSTSETSSSVNDRIEHLRRTQGAAISAPDTAKMLSSQHAPLPPGRRRAAGPPPPRSWIVGEDGTPSRIGQDDFLDEQCPRLSRLPGACMPGRGSLVHCALRSMAEDFCWHMEFDHVYLSTLPIELKLQLLSYISVHGRSGVSRAGLGLLFMDPNASHLQDSTGPYDVTRMDLSGAIGRSLTLTDLQNVLKRSRQKDRHQQRTELVLDSWEDDLDLSDLSSMAVSTPLQFPRLTHLSLAHPAKTVSWQDLIGLSSSLGSLTHLCLDFWPRPSLPEVETVSAQHRSLLDDSMLGNKPSQEQEAALILQQLGRNTPSLTWVSFAGCQTWFDALLPQDDDASFQIAGLVAGNRSRDMGNGVIRSSRYARDMSGSSDKTRKGPDWNGAWRHIRYVNVSQDWIPRGIKTEELMKLVIPRKARSVNREALRAEPFQLPRDREAYRLSSTSDEVRNSIDQGLRRRRWLLMERMSILLASKVDHRRLSVKLPTAEFDFGWGRRELLEIGYEEQTVFDAGL